MVSLAGDGGGNEKPRRLVNTWSVVFTVALMAVLALALWQSRKFNFRAGLFPWAIGFPLLGLTLLQFVREIRGKAGASSRKEPSGEDAELPPSVAARRTRNMFAWIVVYFLAIWLLGFAIGGALCCFVQLKFASKEKWPITLMLTVGLWAFIYLLFDRTLHVPFPPGYVFEVLGFAE
jgi:uncharacterized integral membrane protein